MKIPSRSDDHGFQMVRHGGGQQGTSTDFLIATDQGAGVVVLTNMDGLNPNQLSVEMLKILIGPAIGKK
jgi:hypothetical protein